MLEEGEGGEAVRFRFGVRCLADAGEEVAAGMSNPVAVDGDSSTVSIMGEEGCSMTARSGEGRESSVTCSMVSLAPMIFRAAMDCEARSSTAEGEETSPGFAFGGDEASVV